jgi:hypothetical protein
LWVEVRQTTLPATSICQYEYITCYMPANTKCTVHITQTLYHVFTFVQYSSYYNISPFFPQPLVLSLCLTLPVLLHLTQYFFGWGFSVLWSVCSYFSNLHAISLFIFNHLQLAFVAVHLRAAGHCNTKHTPVPFPLSSSISTFSRFLVQQEFQSGYKYEY